MSTYTSHSELPAGVSRTGRYSTRLTVFLLTFLVSLSIGLYYNFQRPAIYRSSATLLTVAPAEIDQQAAETDIQHVAIQRHRLLSQTLLTELAEKLDSEKTDEGLTVPSVARLQMMLDVVPVPDTNLLELRADGTDASVLPKLVNTWVKVYLKIRADEIRQVTEETTESLSQQYMALGEKITEKRQALDEFRKNNEITSTGRSENNVLSRLKGLNDSLNKAIEEEIKARARLHAVQAAISRGQAVVPDQDKRSLAQLEARAQQLRDQLAELDSRYTREFLSLSSELKVLPEQLKKLENEIRIKQRQGRDIVIATAEREYAAAQQTTAELRQKLDDHKHKASAFTAKFAEHEALVEDLARLEEAYRATEERLVQIEVKNREKYPQLMVLEWAFLPTTPIWPLYLRDAGFILAGSLLVSLFMVWLGDFLVPKRHAEKPATPIDITIYPSAAVDKIEPAASVSLLDSGSYPALAHPSARQLTVKEASSLYNAADTTTKQLIFLLLSGVSPKELQLIDQRNIDITNGRITVPGHSPRMLTLPAAIASLFTENGAPFAGWRETNDVVLDRQELDARLQLAAAAGNLSDSDQITAQNLRHTYIVYLVSQGIRLSDLHQLVGKIPSKILLGYRKFAPYEADIPLHEISTVYPLFSRLHE